MHTTEPAPEPGTWCTTCDKTTRLRELPDDTLQRCPHCHPLRHQSYPQHRVCPRCRQVTFAWDNSPCGHHEPEGTTAP